MHVWKGAAMAAAVLIGASVLPAWAGESPVAPASTVAEDKAGLARQVAEKLIEVAYSRRVIEQMVAGSFAKNLPAAAPRTWSTYISDAMLESFASRRPLVLAASARRFEEDFTLPELKVGLAFLSDPALTNGTGWLAAAADNRLGEVPSDVFEASRRLNATEEGRSFARKFKAQTSAPESLMGGLMPLVLAGAFRRFGEKAEADFRPPDARTALQAELVALAFDESSFMADGEKGLFPIADGIALQAGRPDWVGLIRASVHDALQESLPAFRECVGPAAFGAMSDTELGQAVRFLRTPAGRKLRGIILQQRVAPTPAQRVAIDRFSATPAGMKLRAALRNWDGQGGVEFGIRITPVIFRRFGAAAEAAELTRLGL